MEVNNHVILDDTQDILIELRKQLELNGVKRFAKFIDSGNNIQTNCPFHKEGQERKPSFGINKNTGELLTLEGLFKDKSYVEKISNYIKEEMKRRIRTLKRLKRELLSGVKD